MTVSYYNISNFEANFRDFHKNLNISRINKKKVKNIFYDYYDYLKLSFPAENIGNFSRLFSAKLVSGFKTLFMAKYRNSSDWQLFYGTLPAFIQYLERNCNIYKTISNNTNPHQELLDLYITFLRQKNFSQSTINNYKADINQFLQYLYQNSFELHQAIDLKILNSFTDYLSDNLQLQLQSVKRKISAVSSFLNWLQKTNRLSPTSLNISEIKPKFAVNTKSLPQKPQSPANALKTNTPPPGPPSFFNPPNLFYSLLLIVLSISLTIGIYQQFFAKVVAPQANPIEPKRPGRILSFQGRLTDREGTPVVDKVDLRFKIWNELTGGLELYDSGICQITPDQNGIFYTNIGSTCGKEIESTVFSENTNTYLGITVGTDTEMQPRSQVASVGYALNSETLQGLAPASPANTSTIPFIDKDGHLLIAAENPLIKSASGLFTIEGKNISITAEDGSNGSISISPDGNGSLNFNLEGFTPASSGLLNISGSNIISGSLISALGSALTAGYKLIDLQSGNPMASKFSVDASGNTVLAGSLNVGTSFQSSPSGTLVNSSLTVSGQLFDAGLGIYGTNGNRIPAAIDFTKDTIIEFNFKTASKKIEVRSNINEDGSKYYLFTWNTDGKMTVEKCTPSCTTLTSDTMTWTNNSWHHGFIQFSGTNIKWSIDKGGKSINATVASELPKLSTGYLLFSGESAISNLMIFPSTDLVLTMGNSWIGGRLNTEDTLTTLGSLGAGTANPAEKLDVEGNVEIDASTTTYTEKLCHSGDDNATNDLKLGDCAEDSSDLAEYYGSDLDVSSGDVVAVKDEAYQFESDRSGLTSKAFVLKSTLPYQNSVIGIVSSNPYPDILSKGVFSQEEHPVPVALAGRVPVKVSTENGVIKTGDPITSGTLPGFGMKAIQSGPVVAKALQSFPLPAEALAKAGSQIIPCPSEARLDILCGTVIAFVNVSWYEKPWDSAELSQLAILAEKTGDKLPIDSLKEYLNDLIPENLTASEFKSAYIEAGSIQTQNLTVGVISPLSPENDIKIQGSVTLFGELNARSLEADTASIAATLTTRNLEAQNATVSGTLYAENIKSGQIDELRTHFGDLLEKINNLPPAATPEANLTASPAPSETPIPTSVISPTSVPQPSPAQIASSSSQFSDNNLTELINSANQNTVSLLTFNQKLEAFLNTNPLNPLPQSVIAPDSLVKMDKDIKITGSASLADTSIAGLLLVDGSLTIQNSSITTISDTLYLNSGNLIDFMGGRLIVDKSGNLTVKGNLIAEKGITTPEIRPVDSRLTINLNRTPNPDTDSPSRIGGFGELLVLGNASISGALNASKINLDTDQASPASERNLTAAENFLKFNINAPASISNRSAGTNTIPALSQELVIYNDHLTPKSLIYITPTSTTQNRTIYIAKKEVCENSDQQPCIPYFSVSLDNPFEKDISFNWWLVN